MGCIDTIFCKMPLPEGAPDFVKLFPYFQTSDLGKGCGDYIITESGEIHIALPENTPEFLKTVSTKLSWKRKKILIYASNLLRAGPRDNKYVYFTKNGEDYINITYVVQIRDGKVSSIKELGRNVFPARSLKEF